MQFTPIRALLDWAACREGYPSWPHMLRVRAPPLLATWASVGCTITDLTLVSPLLSLPGAAATDDVEPLFAADEAGGAAVFSGPFGVPTAPGPGGETVVHTDEEVFYPCSHFIGPGSHGDGPVTDMRVVVPAVAMTINDIAGGQESVYDDICHAQQARSPLLQHCAMLCSAA